ncbi:MAG: serine protease [Myxococcota bacterium]
MTWNRFLSAELTVAALVLAGCQTSDVGSVRSAAVYGEDSRRDAYQASDSLSEARALESTVVIVSKHLLGYENPSDLSLQTATHSENASLCEGEAFEDQPAVGFCSGSLIDDDLILTAAHCVPTNADCERSAFVFGYRMAGDGERGTLARDDVYHCRDVVVRNAAVDYAIVHLDRPVVGRAPLPIMPASDLTMDATILLASHPAGLPLKLDDGGVILDLGSGQFFVATVDAIGGSSGGAVLSEGALVGLLISGQTDFVAEGECRVEATYDAGGVDGDAETINYAEQAITALCDENFPSSLCGRSDECGDGVCSGESASECPADCPAAMEGDNLCEPGEEASEDCDMPIPDSWTCLPNYYATGDGCDTGCGAPDPDCSGGGGCATTSSREGWSLVLLLALVIRRRRAKSL